MRFREGGATRVSRNTFRLTRAGLNAGLTGSAKAIGRPVYGTPRLFMYSCV
jgi:hypothetical protein